MKSFLLFSFLFSSLSFAASLEKSKEFVSRNKEGKRNVNYHSTETSSVYAIKVASRSVANLNYIIDTRARLCFATSVEGGGVGMTSVDCKRLKQGYPEIAPVLSWLR